MKRSSPSTFAAALVCIGLMLPPMAFAVQPVDPQQSQSSQPLPCTADIALRPGGLVVGQVVNQAGAPQVGAIVAIRYADCEVVRTTTDKDGVFAAQGLRGGQYQLVTEKGQSMYRFWAVDTAPPSAQQTALIISDDSIVRGQFGTPGYGPMSDWVEWIKCHPYLTAGIVAAAVAVPIALTNDSDSGS